MYNHPITAYACAAIAAFAAIAAIAASVTKTTNTANAAQAASDGSLILNGYSITVYTSATSATS
ncbi:hypothetical protein DF262_004734, partial [Escherichia coli O112]|nr:hypothetical protein [Escherichia coli O112]